MSTITQINNLSVAGVYKTAEFREDHRKHKVPKAVFHRAEAIQRKGVDKDKAYAIAVGKSRNEGRLIPGSMKLTPKGKAWEWEHQKEEKTAGSMGLQRLRRTGAYAKADSVADMVSMSSRLSPKMKFKNMNWSARGEQNATKLLSNPKAMHSWSSEFVTPKLLGELKSLAGKG